MRPEVRPSGESSDATGTSAAVIAAEGFRLRPASHRGPQGFAKLRRLKKSFAHRALAALTLSIGCAPIAWAAHQDVPSSLDHRAAYCLAKANDDASVLRSALALLGPGSSLYQGTAKELSSIKVDTDKLKRYLDARSNVIGSDYLRKVSEEALSDKPIAQGKFDSCRATCNGGKLPRPGPEGQAWAKCISGCQSGVPEVQRQSQCFGVEWLPR